MRDRDVLIGEPGRPRVSHRRRDRRRDPHARGAASRRSRRHGGEDGVIARLQSLVEAGLATLDEVAWRTGRWPAAGEPCRPRPTVG